MTVITKEVTNKRMDTLLHAFAVEQGLSIQDLNIINCAIDKWPMTAIASALGTTHNKVHQRKRILLAGFRTYLTGKGYTSSESVLENA